MSAKFVKVVGVDANASLQIPDMSHTGPKWVSALQKKML